MYQKFKIIFLLKKINPQYIIQGYLYFTVTTSYILKKFVAWEPFNLLPTNATQPGAFLLAALESCFGRALLLSNRQRKPNSNSFLLSARLFSEQKKQNDVGITGREGRRSSVRCGSRRCSSWSGSQSTAELPEESDSGPSLQRDSYSYNYYLSTIDCIQGV